MGLVGIGPAIYAEVVYLNNHAKVTWSKEIKAKREC